MKIYYYGHFCFAVEAGGKRILFDPYVTPNKLAKDVDVDEIPADFILISHGHEDHVADAVRIAKRTKATVICNYEVSEWLMKKGLKNVQGMNHGGCGSWDFGRVKYVSAVHSSVLPDGTYGGNPGGFVIESRDGNFYYSGDTALTLDMKLIGESVRLHFAALCIGDFFTMGVPDAIKACDFIQCNNVLGVHYDTFPPIRLDKEKAIADFDAAGKKLHLPRIGSSRKI